MSKKRQWVRRWRSWIGPVPTLPGVWPRRDGGFVGRVRVKDPRTGKVRSVQMTVEHVDAATAYKRLHEEADRIRRGEPKTLPARMRFDAFAVSLLERKVNDGSIRSAKGREKWGSILEHHLIPAFGDYYLDHLYFADIEEWRAKVARRVHAGETAPATGNDWLAILRVIMKAAAKTYRFQNPAADVDDFDTSAWRTFTPEEPNSLLVSEAPLFLAKMRELYPQFFGMTALGFATGLRPSSLRPLRRRGQAQDINWQTGVLLVRRSHSLGSEVMETTKTKRDQAIALPAELLDVLKWHVDSQLTTEAQQDSELLFPSTTGGFRARSSLDVPFRDAAKGIGLTKAITPKAMRRTFQDLARAAEVRDVVTRAVSGHATEAMQRHYSTVHQDEMRQALGRVVSLFDFKRERGSVEVTNEGPDGGHSGGPADEAKKAGNGSAP